MGRVWHLKTGMSALQLCTGCLLRLFLWTLLLHLSSESGPGQTLTRIVQTRYGKLQGVVRPMNPAKGLKPIEAYLGVPYATPPVGSNRLVKTV